MDQQATTPIVLARIPDLRAVGPETVDGGRLLSTGRLINQALSFKLLTGAVLLLIAMAVVPFLVKRSGAPADSPVVADPLATWQSTSSVAPTGPAPTVLSVGTTVVSSPASDSVVPIPGELPPPVVAGSRPAPASAETPLMSTWPNPAHPTSVSETSPDNSPARVNQAMAIRPTEYLRNSYDRTRSGIH
jgi:hypothetical protein